MFALLSTTSDSPCTTGPFLRHILPDFTVEQDKFKLKKPSTWHNFKIAKTRYQDLRSSASFVRYVVLLVMILVTHTKASTCFNDKLPWFIMDVANANEYAW